MGSSGGGSSGEVDYPQYMKDKHELWLNQLSTNITGMVNPFSSMLAYDPDTHIEYISKYMDELRAVTTTDFIGFIRNELLVTGLSKIDPVTRFSTVSTVATNFWNNRSTSLVDVSEAIEDQINKASEQLDAQIESDVLPKFKAGMRDINAVMSSAFVLGEALIWEGRNRDVAKLSADIRSNALQEERKLQTEVLLTRDKLVAATSETLLRMEQDAQLQSMDLGIRWAVAMAEWERAVQSLRIEGTRIELVAHKEEQDENNNIAEEGAKFGLEVFQHGANMLAAIGGGTVHNQTKRNKAASAIGGALSGAAAGAMVGSSIPGVGTAVGAGVGAVMGALGGAL